VTTATELEQAFRARGVTRGGALYLSAAEAMAMVDAARSASVRVLGIDGFRIGPNTTQPLMEHSCDLSDETRAKNPWQAAIEFISRQPADLSFEVILE